MRIEEVIGSRIRNLREMNEITQEQLGARVGELLGREWPRQAMSTAEKGGRAFTASELVAIAHALGTTVARLVTPPPEVREVELSSGARIPRSELTSGVLPDGSEELILENLRNQLQALAENQALASQVSTRGRELIEHLDERLDTFAEMVALRAGALKRKEGEV